MTVAFFSGKGRRIGVALGAVSAGLLVLSACDKPTPIATVTVGGDSVHSEAACYNDGKVLSDSDAQSCLAKKEGKTIKLGMEERVHFGVDPEIADNGWMLFIDGQQAEQEPYKKTYRTISGSAFFSSQSGQPSKKTRVSVVETKNGKFVGVWHFNFEKAS
ncbi:DUF2771 domain-containing protein [Streptomyces sp. DT171]|uniref:DUF2771 domain-containing protein n=1 Tax=Streptomyces sp. DT171 TaxID=3416524 RepID=UPI003CEAE1F3